MTVFQDSQPARCLFCKHEELQYSDGCFQCGYHVFLKEGDNESNLEKKLTAEITRRHIISNTSDDNTKAYFKSINDDQINQIMEAVKDLDTKSEATNWKFDYSKRIPIRTSVGDGYAFYLPREGDLSSQMFITAGHNIIQNGSKEFSVCIGDDDNQVELNGKVHLILNM